MAAQKYSERTKKPIDTCWGWFWVHTRAPDCLNPGLKSEIIHGTRRTRTAMKSSTHEERSFRRRSNHRYGKQDRAYMRLDKKRSGLAFGLPTSSRFAAGTRCNFQLVNFESYILSVLLFLFICIVYRFSEFTYQYQKHT